MWSNNATERSSDIFIEFVSYFESHVKHMGKRNLVGHSMGGSGAFHMAFDYSQYFDRIASVSAVILKWNPFDATPEMIEEYIREHAPTVPLEYFQYVVAEMQKDFGQKEAFTTFDFYNRIQIKNLPNCFGFFMGGRDPMGFAYLAREFLAFTKSIGKEIYYVENPTRQHEVGPALPEISNFFENCN